jgi:hypothetical protein
MMFKGQLAWLAECRSKITGGKRCRVRPVSPRRSFRPDLEYLEDRVTPSLLVNGDFETGDFTGWTQSGNPGFTSVQSSVIASHGGTHYALLGPVGSEGFLAQTFTTTPGNPYTLNYWLASEGGTPNSFHAMIDGVDLSGSVITDGPAMPYTQFTFTFTAANPTTELKVGFQHDPTFWHLDDVSVDAGTYVVPTVVRTNLTGTFTAAVSTDHLVFNTPIDPATFTISTTNDQYAITDPNGNTINATTITATDPTNTQFDVTFPAQTTNGAYTLTVGPSIADPAGNPMATAFTSTFNVNIVAGNLIVNGDFETGDFTGWTQFGDPGFTGVSSGAPVHGGTYAAFFGPGSLGGITQTVTTTPGQSYTLSLWLSHPFTTTGTEYQVQIDGTIVDDQFDMGNFTYTQFTYTYTALGATSTIQLGFAEPPQYFFLDDVTLAPATPAPAPHALRGGSAGGAVSIAPAEALAAQTGINGSLGGTLLSVTPVTPMAVQASGQMEHAILVDQIFSGLSTKDGLAISPGKLTATEVDPFSLGRLDEGLWSL